MTNLDDIIEGHVAWPTEPAIYGECPGCHEKTRLVLTPSMTRYEDHAKNAPFYVCEPCSQAYQENMKDLWNDYYSSIL